MVLKQRDLQRVDTLQIVVKQETPFLPKVAFALITLASMAGATFTGTGMGLGPGALALRWLTLWSLALAGGFLVWRLIYLRNSEPEAAQGETDALNASALVHADKISRWVAIVMILGAPGALMVPVMGGTDSLTYAMVAASVVVAVLMYFGVSNRSTALPAAVVLLLALAGWAVLDAGLGWRGAIRLLHLSAFTLWLGGALWNIGVAMPAGREHPTVDAVLTGARQLDRFRWVVRFALPTIIITGLIMAWNYSIMPLVFWLSFPGMLIPLKVVAIIALVVVFITCPLFRHCSPVQGVCNTDDLEQADA